MPFPTTTSNVLFLSSSTKNSTVDEAFIIASLMVTSGYSGSINQNYPLTISGDYSQSGGTFNQNAALSVGGNYTHTGGVFTPGAGQTVTFNSAATTNQITGGSSFANVLFEGGGAWSLADSLFAVTGDLTISSGDLEALGESIIVGGNWSNSGTFTQGANETVTLNGANQKISGTTTFDNLKKVSGGGDTLTFASGSTQTVGGLLDLEGNNSLQLLNINSSIPGIRASLNSTGPTILLDLNVSDSNASGQQLVCLTNCIDSGDNLNWVLISIAKIISDMPPEIKGRAYNNALAVNGLNNINGIISISDIDNETGLPRLEDAFAPVYINREGASGFPKAVRPL